MLQDHFDDSLALGAHFIMYWRGAPLLYPLLHASELTTRRVERATALDYAYTSPYSAYTSSSYSYTPLSRSRPSYAPQYAWFANHSHAFTTPHHSSPVAPVRPCELHSSSTRASIHIHYTIGIPLTRMRMRIRIRIGFTHTLTLPQTKHKRKGQCDGDM